MNAVQLDIQYPATTRRRELTPSHPMSSPAQTPLHEALNVPGDFRPEMTDHEIDVAIIRYLRSQLLLLEFFTDSLESFE